MDEDTKRIINAMAEAIIFIGDRVSPRHLQFSEEISILKKEISLMNAPLEISKDDVRYLREYTGEGMMACRSALVKAKGDLQKAKEILHSGG